jgi:hypothetical protein
MKTAVALFVVGVSLTLLLAEGLGMLMGLFVTLLLSGGLGFTLREFKRLSAESEARNHATDKVLDCRNADFHTTFRQLPPKKRFSEFAVYGQSQAASERH